MMSSNIASAEAGGVDQTDDNFWIARWSGWLATMGAMALGFIAMLGTALNILTLSIPSVITSGLQFVAAAIILAIEGSTAVKFLSFAQPIGAFFQGKPVFVRALLYGMLTVIPMIFSPSLLGWLGFIISLAITGIYFVIIVGKKGTIDDMKTAAGTGGDIPRI